MELFRLCDLSLYTYVKEVILAAGYTDRIVGEDLSYSGEVYEVNSRMEPSPVEKGRGWLCFDQTEIASGEITVDLTKEQTGMVTVFAGGSEVPSDEYVINYLQGIIDCGGSSTSVGDPTHIDYYWHYVSVLDGWPKDTNLPSVPIVVVDLESAVSAGFQLGGGTRHVFRGILHVFAGSRGERDDITDVLFHGLYNRCAPIYDFNTQGMYLDFDGKFNSDFDGRLLSGKTSLQFFNVNSQLSGLPATGMYATSRLDRYRSRVTFEMDSYDK